MPRRYKPATVAMLRVVMEERDFKEFSSASREQFLDDLSLISGCPRDEMLSVQVRAGCVVVEVELDEAAVRKLVDLFKAIDGRCPAGDIADLQAFVSKHGITNISAEFRAIPAARKAPLHKQIVVLVHGWRGDESSFGKLPNVLKDRFGCPALVYEYPTGLWGHSPSLIYVARDLDNWFRNHVDAARVGFIAHSMGGVIVRKLLCNQLVAGDRIDGSVRQVTFIASPHNGAVFANIGQHVPTLRTTQLNELSPNSAFLFELNGHWQEWVERKVPNTCHVRSILGSADSIVSANNARGLDKNAVVIAGADHGNIVNIKDEHAQIVGTITRFLIAAGFERAPTKVANGLPER